MPKSGVNIRRSLSLQREIDVDVEEVGDGIDEEQQDEREERRSKQAFAAKQQHHADAIGEDDKRGRRDVKVPLRRDDQDHNGLLAHFDEDGGAEEQSETPPGSVHLPAERVPGAENQKKTNDRNNHADRLESVSGPERPQHEAGRPDGRDTEYGQEGYSSRGDRSRQTYPPRDGGG
jgi:hypothetical protein